ncbi:MAG: arginase [Acidobacteria bacterium]|nr:arginase [Acidobacteriota bacterium]
MRAKKINIIGAPLDFGSGRRGVDMGPSAIRIAGLNDRLRQLGHSVQDLGNLHVSVPESHPPGEIRQRFMKEVSQVCGQLCRRIVSMMREETIPVILGGDHSISIGSVAGVAKYFRARKKKIGLIWMDAHGDMNTPETSPSGNIHGMPLAAILGYGPDALSAVGQFKQKVQPAHTALVGVRDLDPLEKETIRRSGIHVFTMRNIDEIGMRGVMQRAIEVASEDTAGFHVSLDLDFLDPSGAPGVGTPVPGGVTRRESHLAMEIIADSDKMLAFDIVEVNPILDERNSTARMAAELCASVFGKKIL